MYLTNWYMQQNKTKNFVSNSYIKIDAYTQVGNIENF